MDEVVEIASNARTLRRIRNWSGVVTALLAIQIAVDPKARNGLVLVSYCVPPALAAMASLRLRLSSHPQLRADSEGVVVVSLMRMRRFSWAQVDRIGPPVYASLIGSVPQPADSLTRRLSPFELPPRFVVYANRRRYIVGPSPAGNEDLLRDRDRLEQMWRRYHSAK